MTAAPVQSKKMTASDFAGGKDYILNKSFRYSDTANNFKHYGNAALFYVGDGFFTLILIYPYDELLARLTNNDVTVVNLPEVKFNHSIMLKNSKDAVSSGLLRVTDTDGTVTVDLDGLYPEGIESKKKDILSH